MAILNNIIYKGRDNEVIIGFTFDGDFAALGLANFTEITLNLGGEGYSTLSTPVQLFLKDNFTLVFQLGDITSLEVGQYAPDIIGISATYDDGYILNCSTYSKISRIVVKDC